ncbi:MAG: hemagglutinin repeat-containing protein [Rhodocyclaceae bacterium]|nr:hemagglutinin repeat-containing protein [Rhodocyclaceae bacterium]
MNKGIYRLVFNAARGCIMVTAENAGRCGKGDGVPAAKGASRLSGTPRSLLRTATRLATGMGLLASALVQAQIVADPGAPSGERPTVLSTPNDVPLVNIQTPSAAGVSRNTYQQFDVGTPGAVLNNSRINVQTALGGWVQGNPWLARGEARVIVNEVNSSNPSYIRGFIEVAGQRAEVIVANPAGINVDGAGFINASRATLTTGTPVFSGSSLETYRVERGTIRIDGAGLDARLTDYTGILARAIEVNAAIHAQHLQVVSGTNTVSADQTTVRAQATGTASGSTPVLALDVSQLGGMYAGKIALIGTEAGLGVRHHGTLSASVGDVHIDANGWLSSTGQIEARQGNVRVQTAQAQTHSGSITAAGNVFLHAGAEAHRSVIDISGSVRAGLEANLRASDLSNSGRINAQRLDVRVASLSNSGDIWQSGSQALRVSAAALTNASGAAMGAVQTSPSPAPAPVPPAPSSDSTPAPATLADGLVSISGSLLNQAAATIAAAGALHLSATESLTNAGNMRAQTVQVSGQRFETSSGTLLTQDLSVLTSTVTLTGGALLANTASFGGTEYLQSQGAQVYTQDALAVNVQRFVNAGELQSAGNAGIGASDTLINSGRIAAAGNLTIEASGLDSTGTLAAGLNADGSLKAFAANGAALTITATSALKATGRNLAAGAVTLSGASINLTGSETVAYSASITTTGAFSTGHAELITVGSISVTAGNHTNLAGAVYAGTDANFTLAQSLTSTGSVAAAGNLSVHAGSLESSGTLAAGLNADGSLKVFDPGGPALQITTTGDLRAAGTNLATGDIILGGVGINLNGSETSAHSAAIAATGTLSIRAARVVTRGDISLTAAGALDNAAGTAASKAGSLSITTNGVNNTDGLLAAAASLSVDARDADLTNTRGRILAQGDMNLATSAGIGNVSGLIQSNVGVSLNGATIDNSQTSTSSQGIVGMDLSLRAGAVNNTDGQALAERDLAIIASTAITNTRGTLSAKRTLTLQDTASTPNQRALAIGNSSGVIVANNDTSPANSILSITARSLGADGTAQSGGAMALDLVGDMISASGQQIRAGGDLSLQLHGGTFQNAGQWQAGQDLMVRANHIDNRTSGELLSRGVTLLDTTQNSSGTITNRGLVDGIHARINSQTLDNLGTGRIFGNFIAIAAHSLTNREETISGQTSAATIAARERLDVGAQSILNREGALMFSAGDMALSGALDSSNRAIIGGSANSQSLNNHSATLESLGNMALATGRLQNTNEHLSWTLVPQTQTQVTHWLSSELYRQYTETVQAVQVTLSRPGVISVGGNLQLTLTGSGLNQDSQIVVGGAISAQADALSNQSTTVEAPTLRSGTVNQWGQVGEECGWHRWRWKCDAVYGWISSPYQETIAREVPLPVLRFEQNAAPSGSGLMIAALPATGALPGASSGNSLTPTLALDSQSLDASVQGPGQADSGSGALSTPTLSPQPAPALVLPNSSLFRIDPGSNARYVVETDPRFASYRQWLSSDYMLSALGADPALTEKRLGDGFYEQRLIRDQVAALTGYRFLGDYRSDEQQYRALMNAGATLAKAQQLRPGIALSAQQVAQLTSDVVWLVSRTVQLPDGTTTTALVPQVYLAPRPGDLDASGALFGGAQATGALISASDISLALQGTLNNSGTIAGRRLLNIGAGDIRNSGLVQGDAVLLNARQDLSIDGGRVAAVTGLAVRADGALSITSTTAQGAGAAGNGVFASRQLDRVAGLYVSGPAGSLLASAGGALTLTAAQIRNAGTGISQLQSDGSLTLDTVRLTSSLDVTRDSRNYARANTSQDAGSDISAAGSLTLLSRGDMELRAARLQAADALDLSATQGSIAIQAGQSSFDMQTASYSRSRGGFLGLGSSSTTQRSSTSLTTAVASELGGARIAIGAGQGLEITASNVLADREVSLGAAGDITLRAGQNTRTESSFSATSRSGLFSGGGLSLTLGRQQFSLDQQASFTTAAPATVGSLAGNVTIRAGGAYTQVGSHLLAPGGDIAIEAQRVDILEARETSRQQTETRSRQSGLTLALTNPVVNAVQTAQQMGAAAADTRDGRMKALAAASTALAARDGAQAFRANPGQAGGINLSISLGGSQSSSASLQTSDRAAGSTVAAGGDIDIRATGASGDITVRGSTLRAGEALRLSAEDSIALLGAANQASLSSTSRGSSAAVGVGIALGGGAGPGLTLAGSTSRGSAAGDDLSWSATRLEGLTLRLDSGGDTTVRGALLGANRVEATVAGNLLIESLQDTSTYQSRQSATGGSLTLGPTPGGSLNLARGRINSDFASVNEQSGLAAGDGGFSVQVAGTTTLRGGAITSSEPAVAGQRNRFDSGALSVQDVANRAGFYGESVAVNLATAGSSSGLARQDGGAASLTQAAISGIAGNRGARTGDAATGLAPVFDAERVQKELDAQVVITQRFGLEASQAITQFAASQRAALRQLVRNASTPEEQAQTEKAIKDVNMQERALNILASALTGNAGSMITKEALSTAAEKMRDLMVEDSLKFPGVVDKVGNPLFSNLSGESAGVNGDGRKIAGTRVDLDLLCGRGNERCKFEKNADGSINTSKPVTFLGEAINNADGTVTRKSYDDFLQTPDGTKMLSAPFGGLQGGARTWLFGMPYEKGGWVDKLLETFAGPHDLIGGKASGLYDDQGNATRGRSDSTKLAHEIWSGVALVPAAPLAASQFFSPEAWKAISILLKAAQ